MRACVRAHCICCEDRGCSFLYATRACEVGRVRCRTRPAFAPTVGSARCVRSRLLATHATSWGYTDAGHAACGHETLRPGKRACLRARMRGALRLHGGKRAHPVFFSPPCALATWSSGAAHATPWARSPFLDDRHVSRAFAFVAAFRVPPCIRGARLLATAAPSPPASASASADVRFLALHERCVPHPRATPFIPAHVRSHLALQLLLQLAVLPSRWPRPRCCCRASPQSPSVSRPAGRASLLVRARPR
jgi:hypothetical protein